MRNHALATAFPALLLSTTMALAQSTGNSPTPAVGVRQAANAISSGAPLPAPLGVPKPGPTNDAPYAPQPILQGGVVITLYPPARLS
jgi:hypothetical protein